MKIKDLKDTILHMDDDVDVVVLVEHVDTEIAHKDLSANLSSGNIGKDNVFKYWPDGQKYLIIYA